MSIDYKSEVLRVYPDAYEVGTGNFEAIIVVDLLSDGHCTQLCEDTFPKADAWKVTYNNLVKQNKITPPTNDYLTNKNS